MDQVSKVNMNIINASSYIHGSTPISQAVIDASGWYATESMTLSNADPAQVPWLMAQGWAGVVTTTEVTRKVLTPLAPVWGEMVGTGVFVCNGTLTRRILKAELALKALVASFTAAYNEGRELNDTRYDEIVTLYAVMIDQAQMEITSLEAADSTYDGLVQIIITAIGTDYDAYAADVTGALATYGAGSILQINTRFDNELAKARTGLVNRGMYNTTIWNSISAGIERERTLALSDFNDKIIKLQVEEKHRLHQVRVGMRQNVLAARDRLRTQFHDSRLRRLDLRDQVLTALNNFMERRTDSYPDLGSLATLAGNLGAGASTITAP